jgi:hypothetical protein
MKDPLFFLAAACSVLVVILNSNSWYNGFALDDVVAVVENQDIRPDKPIGNVFLNDFWGMPMHHHRSHKCYRPFVVLSFRLNYYFHGLDPFGFHIVNTLLSMIVTTQVILLCDDLFGRQRLPATGMAGLLFASHPIHTEAVSARQSLGLKTTSNNLPPSGRIDCWPSRGHGSVLQHYLLSHIFGIAPC